MVNYFTEVFLQKLINRVNLFLPQVAVEIFKHFWLVAGPENQTPEDKQHQNEPWEVSAWRSILSTV